MSKLTVRSLKRVSRTVDFVLWCRDLAKNGPHPVEPLKRFAIAHYQIAQGIEWDETIVPDYEAYAAAAIHFTVTAELYDIGLEEYLPEKIKDFPATAEIDWKRLCYVLSKAQQMVVYASHPKRIKRGSRFNPDLLKSLLSEAVFIMIGNIPRSQRSHWIETATDIMIGSL